MKKKTQQLTLTAALVALVLILGLTPIGMIPLGFINISILAIPVVVGTLLLGLKTGLLLGFCFGTISALGAFGIYGTPSALAGALVAANPVLALIMCYLPRLLVPVFVHFAFRFVSRGDENSRKALPVAAVAGSLCNTIFYLGLMLLFYTMLGLDNSTILALIGGTGLIAGGCEAVAAAVITTPIVIALRKIYK